MTRYRLNSYRQMVSSSDGGYVHYADALKLEQRVKELEDELSSMTRSRDEWRASHAQAKLDERAAVCQAWADCAGMIREAKKHYENEDIMLTMHVALDCLAAKIDAADGIIDEELT